MPFDQANSAKYQPLTAEQFRHAVIDFSLKPKANALTQIADLYLYPMRRHGYDLRYLPHEILSANKRIIDTTLPADDQAVVGVKYSCFDGVVRA